MDRPMDRQWTDNGPTHVGPSACFKLLVCRIRSGIRSLTGSAKLPRKCFCGVALLGVPTLLQVPGNDVCVVVHLNLSSPTCTGGTVEHGRAKNTHQKEPCGFGFCHVLSVTIFPSGEGGVPIWVVVYSRDVPVERFPVHAFS